MGRRNCVLPGRPLKRVDSGWFPNEDRYRGTDELLKYKK